MESRLTNHHQLNKEKHMVFIYLNAGLSCYWLHSENLDVDISIVVDFQNSMHMLQKKKKNTHALQISTRRANDGLQAATFPAFTQRLAQLHRVHYD